MKTKTFLTLLTFNLISFFMMAQSSIYDFSFNSIDGKEINFSEFKGENILIVNTASKCGYTKQYEDLQNLHEKHPEFVIIGFPANNFGGQEPGTNEDIVSFCQKNFGVSFLLAEKSSVKGDDISDLFKWLITQENNSFDGNIKWNFEKIIIDKDGQVKSRYRSGTNPMDEDIINDLKS
jgi:glutathione peroxidase